MEEYTVFHIDTDMGAVEFRYNNSLTVNVYIDGVEVDVFTLSSPSIDAARASAEEWMTYMNTSDISDDIDMAELQCWWCDATLSVDKAAFNENWEPFCYECYTAYEESKES